MGMIGPLNLTVWQPYKINLPIDANRVQIDNDSQYDILVSFKNVAPVVVTSSNGEWDAVVRRQHTSVIPITGVAASTRETTYNALGAFQGIMWLCQVNPGALALTGTVSGRNQTYVTPFGPYDPTPVIATLPTQHDISSQPRMIAVPVSQSVQIVGHNDFGAAGTFNPFPGTIAVPPAGQTTWNGVQQVFAYLYFMTLMLGTVTGSPDWAQVYLNVIELDGGGSQVKAWLMHVCELRANTTNGTGYAYTFTPAFPQSAQIQPSSSTAYLAVQLNLNNAGSYPCRIYYNIGIDTDVNSGIAVPSIGGGLEGYWDGAGSAPLF